MLTHCIVKARLRPRLTCIHGLFDGSPSFFDLCPDQLTQNHLKDYFSALVKNHSWSTVKVDRNGLQFFYKYVIERPWVWVDIIKPPQKRVLPDILSVKEVERIINGTSELRYQTFLLTAYPNDYFYHRNR